MRPTNLQAFLDIHYTLPLDDPDPPSDHHLSLDLRRSLPTETQMETATPSPRLTAEQAAIVILYVIDQYRREKEKDVTRLRFSRSTMRKLCLRKNLHESFAGEVITELAEWGWTMFPAGDDFALVQTSVLSSWLRLGSKRISAERRLLRKGDFRIISDMLKKIEPPPIEDDDDD